VEFFGLQNVKTKIHWGFWLLVLLGLFWNIAGAINYIMQTKPDFTASLPETHRAIVEGRPAWATAGFAIGVFGGISGCLLLLLKKPIAGLVFMLSLLGIFVTVIHTLNVVLSKSTFALSEIFIMVVLPLVVANFLIGLTFYAMKKNWLN